MVQFTNTKIQIKVGQGRKNNIASDATQRDQTYLPTNLSLLLRKYEYDTRKTEFLSYRSRT